MKKTVLFILMSIISISCFASGGTDGASGKDGTSGKPAAWKTGNPIVEGNNISDVVTRSINSYKTISSEDSLNLILELGKKNEVILNGEENIIPHIITEVNSDELRIAFATEKDGQPLWIKKINKPIKITIRITRELALQSIKSNGSGNIKSEYEIATQTMNIIHNGSGDINLKLKSDSTIVDTKGSGNITLSGITDTFVATSYGSGSTNAKKLTSKDVTVKITGSGDMEIQASKTLNASIHGSGDIRYRGNATVVTNIEGSGNVIKLD